MTTSRKQHITLQLHAHRISLDVPVEHESFYRRAAEILNEKYLFYQQKYKTLVSAELLWVYVALEIAVSLAAEEDAREKDITFVKDKVQELNKLILQNIK
jgi:hypothetical protein